MPGNESFRSLSLSWLGMLNDRNGAGTGGFGSWYVEDRLGVSPPNDLDEALSGKVRDGVLAMEGITGPPSFREAKACSRTW